MEQSTRNTWESTIEEDAKTQILRAWKESNDKPGKYLVQLRELQQKSLKDISTELGLSVAQLNALENDDKEKLPAPIYVKSYIKRYCLCLGVSESEIAGVLEEISKDVLPTLNRVSLRHPSNIRQSIMRWLGYALIAVFVILLLRGLMAMNLGGLWESVSSSSDQPASNATELSLPMVQEDEAQ